MGWASESLRLTVLMDAHGGDRERRDAQLWCALQWRIEAMVMDGRYDHLDPDLSSHECDRLERDCQATKREATTAPPGSERQ